MRQPQGGEMGSSSRTTAGVWGVAAVRGGGWGLRLKSESVGESSSHEIRYAPQIRYPRVLETPQS